MMYYKQKTPNAENPTITCRATLSFVLALFGHNAALRLRCVLASNASKWVVKHLHCKQRCVKHLLLASSVDTVRLEDLWHARRLQSIIDGIDPLTNTTIGDGDAFTDNRSTESSEGVVDRLHGSLLRLRHLLLLVRQNSALQTSGKSFICEFLRHSCSVLDADVIYLINHHHTVKE